VKRNCIVKTAIDEVTYWWHGCGWTANRNKASLESLSSAENLVENMRGDDLMAWWERKDKKRSSL